MRFNHYEEGRSLSYDQIADFAARPHGPATEITEAEFDRLMVELPAQTVHGGWIIPEPLHHNYRGQVYVMMCRRWYDGKPRFFAKWVTYGCVDTYIGNLPNIGGYPIAHSNAAVS